MSARCLGRTAQRGTAVMSDALYRARDAPSVRLRRRGVFSTVHEALLGKGSAFINGAFSYVSFSTHILPDKGGKRFAIDYPCPHERA